MIADGDNCVYLQEQLDVSYYAITNKWHKSPSGNNELVLESTKWYWKKALVEILISWQPEMIFQTISKNSNVNRIVKSSHSCFYLVIYSGMCWHWKSFYLKIRCQCQRIRGIRKIYNSHRVMSYHSLSVLRAYFCMLLVQSTQEPCVSLVIFHSECSQIKCAGNNSFPKLLVLLTNLIVSKNSRCFSLWAFTVWCTWCGMTLKLQTLQ